MPHTLFSIIFDIIEILFVTYSINIVCKDKKWKKELCFYLLLYLLGYILLEDISWNTYIIKKIYLLFVIILYLYKCKLKMREYIPIVCALLSAYEFLELLTAVVGSMSLVLLTAGKSSNEIIATMLSLFFIIMFVCFLIHLIKNKMISFEFSFFKKCMAYFIYVVVISSRIPYLYTDIKDGYVWKLIFLTIICCTIIFFVISRIERRNAEMERAKIEENNKKLSSKLHKSQEIIPAVVQVLSNVAENNGREMEGQETQELLNEMTDLLGRQLKENSKEDLQLKNFCSTGLKVLDQQLKVYQMEAIDRGVNLDIYVQAPINDIMKKNDIDQLKLLRAVGDLVRNAFRITEKQYEKCRANGHILLIIGCQYEGILEIAVVDNGEPFPLFVIEAFGRRGVTVGGTGNGLADLMEFAEETKASIRVEEFDWETNSFTKKVSIIFDKQRKNYLKTYRKELIKSSFWTKIE